MSDKDLDTLQIVDPRVIQGKVDAVAREKVLQATADEVTLRQLGIHQGSTVEANSEAIDLSTFNMKADIKSALSPMEEAKATLQDQELGPILRNLHRCLHRASKTLKSAWEHTQITSLANAGVKYVSIATVDVGARAVHSGLHTLRTQAFRVGTCAQGHQTDVMAQYASIIPLSNHSLFGGGLKTIVAKVASTAREYAAMADSFVQSGLNHPRPLQGVGTATRELLRVLCCPFMLRNASPHQAGVTGPLPPRGRGQATITP